MKPDLTIRHGNKTLNIEIVSTARLRAMRSHPSWQQKLRRWLWN